MSNTRAITPATGDAPVPTRLLQAGPDALCIAHKGGLNDIELSRMARAANGGRTGVQVAGDSFELEVHEGRVARFLLRNAACTVVVARDFHGFGVVVEFRALHLRTTPLSQSLAHAERLALHFMPTVHETRVRRLDLCADATGLTFRRDDEDRCVSRARRKVRFQAPERSFTRRMKGEPSLTGFFIAPKNPLSVRIYDKTEELFAVQGEDSEKTRTELAAYRSAGWDGVSPVWRVEAQLRSPVLKELGAQLPCELAASLNGIWRYVVGGEGEDARAWVRFVEPGTATRAERCVTDERWRVYQRASFDGERAVDRVPGSAGGVPAQQAVGAMLSYLGATGGLSAADSDASPLEQLRADARQFAERLATYPNLLEGYCRKREAARGRHSRPARRAG